MKPLILQAQMQDKNGILIPKGTIAFLTCEIYDEKAIFYFSDNKITHRFAMVSIEQERKKGQEKTFYSERLQKIMTLYKGKPQKEVKEIIVKELNQFGVKIKNG